MDALVTFTLHGNLAAVGAAFFVSLLALYVVVAGAAHLLLWGRPAARRYRIQRDYPWPHAVRAEVGWSVASIAVFSAVAIGATVLIRRGWTGLYVGIEPLGWGYYALSIAAVIVLHDTWFYWTHRLLHWRPLMRHVHIIHHQSHNPSPWAAFAFHPVEALVQALVVPLIMMALPMHASVLFIFFLFMVSENVVGHMGYELHPRWQLASRLGRWINTSTHHNLHHSRGTGNYSLYFNFWDRVMHTNRPEYEGQFHKVVQQRRQANHIDAAHPQRIGQVAETEAP